MRILFIGDVVGSLGCKVIKEHLPQLKRKYSPQLTVVNGENSAGGRGITEKIYKQFLKDGADVVTLGNHAWDNKDIFNLVRSAKKLVRPINLPLETTPGVGAVMTNVNGKKVVIINLQGRSFMSDVENPFFVINQWVTEIRYETPIIFVDFHAETTSEKQAMGWFLDGKVSAICGTHTHVQTADARILPKKTAYLTDVGMTGPLDGVLGMKKEPIIEKFLTSLPQRFEVLEKGRFILSGVVIDIHEETGEAMKIETFQISDDQAFALRE